MTAQTTKTDEAKQAKPEAPLAIDFDAREFFQFVAETDWSDEQKIEYITLVWGIVFDLVMGGVTVNALDNGQNAGGQLPENCPDKGILPRSMVNSSHGQLLEKFTRLSPDDGRSNGRGVIDE